MNARIATLAALTLTCGTALQANSATFVLGSWVNQEYTFQRTDAPVGTSVTIDVGPYNGTLTENGVTTNGSFFCISYTKTANWNTSYDGKVVDPSTEQQLEAAYLDSELVADGGMTANLNLYKGPIAMAIWQIMDPTLGDVPRDQAAQDYVTQAQNAYKSGQITASMFSNTEIFIPNQSGTQSFMLLEAATALHQYSTPEPGPIVLVACGMLLLGVVRRKPAR